jgi:prepilin-type N-terminal cleavage/methylation domain-containing protein
VPADERGFTIVEVLVAAVVLATGIAGFLEATLVAERLRLRSRAVAEAAQLAEAGLERVAALGYTRATAGLPAASFPALRGGAAPEPLARARSRGFDYLVLYEPPGAAAPPRIAVRCFWALEGRGFTPGDSVGFATRVR